MLESILFLAAGILFIMTVLTLWGKKADVIRCFMLAVSVFFVLYTIFASVLITVQRFSVNRTFMLIDIFLVALIAVTVIKLKKFKLSWSLRLRPHILPLIICAVFAVVGVGVINDGFFGMDSKLGVTQAKAINLASKNDINPFEAEYLTKLEPDAYNAATSRNAELAGKYENYNVPLTAILAFGAYFFGYAHMAAVFVLIGICVIYICWCLLGNIKVPDSRRLYRVLRPAGQILLAAVFIIALWAAFGRGSDRKVLEWKELDRLDRIISEYDAVILDESIMDKYYVPLAGITRAKIFPRYTGIEEELSQLKEYGERVYYLSGEVISSDTIDAMGLYLKNVYHNDSEVMYRALSFYKTHRSVNYTEITDKILIIVFMGFAIFALMLFFAGIFKNFDAGLNLLLSTAVTLGIYALASCLLISMGKFDVAYTAAVTMAAALAAYGITFCMGRAPEFSFKARKSAVIMITCAAVIVVMTKALDGNLYETYRALGRNQVWALSYLYDSSINLDAIKQIPMLSAMMSFFGRMFGKGQMLLVLPAFTACVAVVIFVILERIINAVSYFSKTGKHSFISHAVINVFVIALVIIGTSGLLDAMKSKNTAASWEAIDKMTDNVEPDDSIAIQRSLYGVYRYPVQIITGVSSCFRTYDYDDAVNKLGNTGKDTFYLTAEIKDPSFERIKVVFHDFKVYMYETHDYLTKKGIYSVSDSVTQGFHETDFSGMAWTKEYNAFIQCDIPYRKYDTVRLYLGSEIKLEDINIAYIDIEFRENWYYVQRLRIDKDNNGKYIDFKLNWDYMIDGYNVIYFHSGILWSPLIYGDRDTRIMGFPFHYIQFLNTGIQEEIEEV